MSGYRSELPGRAPMVAREGRDAARPAARVVHRKSVLVVDNEPSMTAVVERVIGNEFVVRGCTDAEEAYALILRGSEFAVVLCDVLMPGMSGAAFYDRLNRLVPDQAARLVFMTGAASLDEVKSFLASVPCLVLEKPFKRDKLRDVVREVAGRSGGPEPLQRSQ